MGVTTYTCMDCERSQTVEEQGSYPRLHCEHCEGERPFIHPTDVHDPDPELAAKYDYDPTLDGYY